MSYDLGVWYPHQRLSNTEAGQIYVALCESRPTPLQAHAAVEAFYNELCALFPEIDDIPEDRLDDHDYCPWSCAHDRSDAHVIMCCVFSQADNVDRLVHNLTRKHGLAVYNPQSETITHPDDEVSDSSRRWWRFW